jgi:hypothetical protein
MLQRLIEFILRLLGFGRTTVSSPDEANTKREGKSPQPLPAVRVNRDFVSQREQRFYHTLLRTIGPDRVVFVQVALNRLFWFPPGKPGMSWQGKMARRSVDYVVCDAKTLIPELAIELDDSSHRRADREVRDDEVNAVFIKAGLRLVRVPASCTPEELRVMLAG